MTKLLFVVKAALASGIIALMTLFPAIVACAHSLTSSTISIVLGEGTATAKISVAVASLNQAMGTATSSQNLDSVQLDEATNYLGEHLSIVGPTGSQWSEQFASVTVETIDEIESYVFNVDFDTAGSNPANFTLTYDAVIEAQPTHEAVVILTAANGDISTAGVISAGQLSLTIGEAAVPGWLDMFGFGFHHVLEGADHMLFLLTLMLVAPVVFLAGKWTPRDRFMPALRRVGLVVSMFTLGHTITLISSALGWVVVPSAPVEILVALSVGIAAFHAIMPLIAAGEAFIAGIFGLVHGLAFAGILETLGLSKELTVMPLLAFNVGVELAQLLAVTLVFPSLYFISKTRWNRKFRNTIAGIALGAAGLWILDRTGMLPSPLVDMENFTISASGGIVVGFAALAALLLARERKLRKHEALEATSTDVAWQEFKTAETV